VKVLFITICSKLTDWLFGTLTSMGIATAVEASKQFHFVTQSFWDAIYKQMNFWGVTLYLLVD